MNINQQRTDQIYNYICENDLPVTRSDIARHLGLRASPVSPYLINLIEALVDAEQIEKKICVTGKNRFAWGYTKSVN